MVSEKPDDQMTEEECNAARLRVLDELTDLSQRLGLYDEPFVSENPLARP